ncbi:uncharacterized protein LOC123272990 [Cotesia glomerata]|uniref:BED-type domain-containing protein n=1 Tax=Cotesia glomerata TaxID=32391 RepID=A0AAV7IML5_COTGL|nr:uncharacterized protein LOC123272990 [Cotesia glomerata]KAH0564196.1 hypothetical protein KQX54_010133 [Cotesia glomerata]
MVKKRGLVWTYYHKKVDGTSVVAFCKFCNRSYIQNATRMEKHLARCEKATPEVKALFLRVSTSKRVNRARLLGAKIGGTWIKKNGDVTLDISNLTEADLEDISEWNRQKEELKEFRNHSEIVVPAQNVECLEEEDDPTWSSEQEHSKTNNRPSEVEDKKTPIIVKDNNEYESIPDHDYELTEEEEGHQVVCYDENDFEKGPINDPMSTKSPVGGGGGSSPLKNKILHEQLLERRALRKIAEIELKRKTLELERSQYEFEQEKMCGEVRWAHEKRLMQYKEERERKLSQQ